MPSCIELEHVSVAFKALSVLDDVTLDIPSGKITGLLGPSGAGKTTLMRVIVGQRRPKRGRVTTLGLPAGNRKLRGRIGYMTQALSIYPDLSVRENLRYFATIMGMSWRAIDAYVQEVGLAPQLQQVAGTLSGGQKARLSLAIVLMGNPELLILDEPTVGVDPLLRRELWNIFHQLADNGKTLLISSHVMDEASHCDDLLLIRDGSVLAHDSPSGLCARTHTNTVEDAFLKLVEAKQ